jgi:hypothetical protein
MNHNPKDICAQRAKFAWHIFVIDSLPHMWGIQCHSQLFQEIVPRYFYTFCQLVNNTAIYPRNIQNTVKNAIGQRLDRRDVE